MINIIDVIKQQDASKGELLAKSMYLLVFLLVICLQWVLCVLGVMLRVWGTAFGVYYTLFTFTYLRSTY
jgi:hypothetical protein